MSFANRPRAEDPNVSMRLIEKIRHKCQDYYRDPSDQTDSYLASLHSDIQMFKKDCLVATELAQQYITKTIESSPVPINRSETLKLEYQLEKLMNENSLLKKQIQTMQEEMVLKPEPVNLDELKEVKGSVQDEENLVSELQAQLVIQELKFENALADLESENREVKEKNLKLSERIKESEKKVESLEKKLKESITGYSKFLVRKAMESKEVQTGGLKLSIEIGPQIEVQRSTDAMSQISKLSITESEIFDVTSMQVCDFHTQSEISVKKHHQPLNLSHFSITNKTKSLNFENLSLSFQITPIPKPIKLTEEKNLNTEMQVLKLCSINSQDPIKPITKPQKKFNTQFYTSTTVHAILELKPEKILNIQFCTSTEIHAILPLKPEKKLNTQLCTLTEVHASHFRLTKTLNTQLCTAIEIHSKLNQSLQPCKLEVYRHELEVFPLPLRLGLTSTKVCSHKAQTQILQYSKIFCPPNSPFLSIFRSKGFSTVKKLEVSFESLAVFPKPAEESKARINRRKSTLNSSSDRKPAIEEFFSLTFQAAKMKSGKSDKGINQEELYKKATADNIPFFEWQEWITKNLR